jgi:hypothetical protein
MKEQGSTSTNEDAFQSDQATNALSSKNQKKFVPSQYSNSSDLQRNKTEPFIVGEKFNVTQFLTNPVSHKSRSKDLPTTKDLNSKSSKESPFYSPLLENPVRAEKIYKNNGVEATYRAKNLRTTNFPFFAYSRHRQFTQAT